MEAPLLTTPPQLAPLVPTADVEARYARVRATAQRKGGSLVELLEWIISTGDEDMMWSFLSTYRIFAPPLEVLQMWMNMYTDYASAQLRDFNHRMFLFMRFWVKNFYEQDFKGKPALYELLDYINKNLPRTEVNVLKLAFAKPEIINTPIPSSITPALRSLAVTGAGGHRKSSMGAIKSLPMLSNAKPRASTSISSISRSPTIRNSSPLHKTSRVYIEDLSPSEIAINLTAIEYSYLEKIQPEELFHMNWQKSERETLAPNISAFTQRFNQVSFWVATEVVTAPTPKQRVAILKKFIKSAQKVRELNNYNSVMEIVAGLNNSSVQRLKSLWNMLPSQYMTQWTEIENLMSPMQNFKGYREEIKNTEPPAIPYFAPMLRDITFIYDGNREYLSPGTINFEIMDLLGSQIRELNRYQRVAYNLPTDPRVLSYLRSVRPMDEEILRKFSFKAEPSGRNTIREGSLTSPLSKSDSDFSLFPSSEFSLTSGPAPCTPRDDIFGGRRTEQDKPPSTGLSDAGHAPGRLFNVYDSTGSYVPLNSPRNRKSMGITREPDQIIPRIRSRSVVIGDNDELDRVVTPRSMESKAKSSTSGGIQGKTTAPPINPDNVVPNIYKMPRPKMPPKQAPKSPRAPTVPQVSTPVQKRSMEAQSLHARRRAGRSSEAKWWLPRWGDFDIFRGSRGEAADMEDDHTGDDHTEEDDSSSKRGESDTEGEVDTADEEENENVDDYDDSSGHTEGVSTADYSEAGSEGVRSVGDSEATEECNDDEEDDVDDDYENGDSFSLLDDDPMEGSTDGSGISEDSGKYNKKSKKSKTNKSKKDQDKKRSSQKKRRSSNLGRISAMPHGKTPQGSGDASAEDSAIKSSRSADTKDTHRNRRGSTIASNSSPSTSTIVRDGDGSSDAVVHTLHSYYDAFKAKIEQRRGSKSGICPYSTTTTPSSAADTATLSTQPTEDIDRQSNLKAQLHKELKAQARQGDLKHQMKVLEFKDKLHKELENRHDTNKKELAQEMRKRMHTELHERVQRKEAEDGAKKKEKKEKGKDKDKEKDHEKEKQQGGSKDRDNDGDAAGKDPKDGLPRWRRSLFITHSRSSNSIPLPSPTAKESTASNSLSLGKASGSLIARLTSGNADGHASGRDSSADAEDGNSSVGGGTKKHARKRSLGQGTAFLRELLHRDIRATVGVLDDPTSDVIVPINSTLAADTNTAAASPARHGGP